MTDSYWQGIRFCDAEYGRRIAGLRTRLAAGGLDAVVLTDDRLTWYLTGFGDSGPIGSPARPRLLVVTPTDAAFFIHESVVRCVSEMSAVERLEPYRRLGNAPVDAIVAFLASQGARRVGFELSGEFRTGVTALDLDGLRSGVPDACDAGPLLRRQLAVKSAAEVERIERACQITGASFAATLPSLEAGMTEREVGVLLTRAMTDAGAEGAWHWVASGRGEYDRVDGVPRERPIERGDLVFVDMGARVGGYWADFSRAAVIGAASDDQRRLQAEIAAITAIGVDALRPGRSLGDAAALIADAMDHAGLAFSANAGRFGHGLGMWATEPPDLVVGSEVAIESGMVLTVEPATVTHEGMFHCEQNVVVTDVGPRILSTAPVDLIEVG